MNSMKKLSSDKGITLLDVIIYMIATLLVIGLMTSVRQFFFGKMKVVQSVAKYAQEFDNFNAYFVKDVKKNENVTINEISADDIKIILSDNTVYSYKKRTNSEIGDIYRNAVKVASNVKSLNCTKNIIYINNTRKILLRLEIVIGGKSKQSFTKAIQYTFKY